MIGWRQGEGEACEMRVGESESESASKEEKDGIHIVSIIIIIFFNYTKDSHSSLHSYTRDTEKKKRCMVTNQVML